MTTYDFLWAKQVILSNILTDFSLIHFHFFGQLSHELAYIMTTYDFLWAKQVILTRTLPDFTFGQLLI